MADGSAKLSGRDYEVQEPTLRRESTARRENLSGESHGDREEFRPEESEYDAEARKDFWSIQWYFIYRHHIEPRSSTYVPREESVLISQDVHYWTKLLREEICDAVGGIGEKPKHPRQKQNQLSWYFREGRNSVFLNNFAPEFVPMISAQESFSLNFSEGESKHMLSRLVAQRICETQFFK